MFGLGFTEIMIIAVIAILFLGPDKLPSAMVEVAKFFKNVKSTVGTVKESLEQEMNVSEIKAEALAYKKELLDAQDSVKKASGIDDVSASLTNLGDDLLGDDLLHDMDDDEDDDEPKPSKKSPKPEKVTFEKKTKKTKKEEIADV